MNISDRIQFKEKGASVLKIQQSDRTKIIAIALKANEILKKHKANIPSFLVVLKGQIQFELPDSSIHLNEHDTFNIPVSIEHEVIALEDSIFMLVQELELGR